MASTDDECCGHSPVIHLAAVCITAESAACKGLLAKREQDPGALGDERLNEMRHHSPKMSRQPSH